MLQSFAPLHSPFSFSVISGAAAVYQHLQLCSAPSMSQSAREHIIFQKLNTLFPFFVNFLKDAKHRLTCVVCALQQMQSLQATSAADRAAMEEKFKKRLADMDKRIKEVLYLKP